MCQISKIALVILILLSILGCGGQTATTETAGAVRTATNTDPVITTLASTQTTSAIGETKTGSGPGTGTALSTTVANSIQTSTGTTTGDNHHFRRRNAP